mmetsp:Transcript_28565/g.70338  ORF Transcript_28565/g.70338 Transcript_28565/m.70338 type:complete len:87 (+) Transcript_28565:59-319(+)
MTNGLPGVIGVKSLAGSTRTSCKLLRGRKRATLRFGAALTVCATSAVATVVSTLAAELVSSEPAAKPATFAGGSDGTVAAARALDT